MSVLRDYAAKMVVPALELYTNGLMTDARMLDAFIESTAKPAAAQHSP